MAAARAKAAPYLDRIAALPLDEIQADPQLSTFAIAGGRAIFAENCAPCHGAGGGGRHTAQAAFPALVDDDWLWGGTLDAIHTTIDHGIRSPTDMESRFSLMPRFGADGILSPDQVGAVADYVLGLSQGETAADGDGATLFAQNCASCHGPSGRGDPELGAPNLSDAIWLYGGTRADIVRQVTDPRQGVMPAWIGRLDDPSRKMVALYVHALGGGL
jgi:cytochrome c oxidase cbb3-type subunit 3